VEEQSPTTAVYVQKAERVERSGDQVQLILTNPIQLSMLESKEHKAVSTPSPANWLVKPFRCLL
jgi:hypothetical protein